MTTPAPVVTARGKPKAAIKRLTNPRDAHHLIAHPVGPLTINMVGYKLFELLHYCNFLQQVDLILPIPADAERYSIRGYNQQGEIARALCAYSSIPMYSNILQKIRTTRSIHTLSSTNQRRSELAGSMNVPQDKFYLVETKVVLLIDDVVTYGTHFKEARNVLWKQEL